MGVDTRRPPLPAPTEDPSSMDNETDLATEVSRRTDHTSYSIPEDGRPITITTAKPIVAPGGLHSRNRSQTSLLIEYFEAGKNGDKSRSKPSVRVKVRPSAARRSKNGGGSDAVHITGIGKDRKPSYTRRISLGSRSEGTEKIIIDGTDVSRSTDSHGSGRPPVEVEVLNPSDLSNSRHSRDLRFVENPSDISSMPPDSILDPPSNILDQENTKVESVSPLNRKRSRSLERLTTDTKTETTHLMPDSHARTRSLSRERITQKVMEKLAARPIESTGRRRNVEYEPDTKPVKERRRRSSRTHHTEDVITPESSQLSSNITASQNSYRSGTSKVSLNNPRLLEMVEDTVRRLILPELHQMRAEQKTSKNLKEFDQSRRTSAVDRDSYSSGLEPSLSKSSSSPNIRGKPKVVLNRHDNDPGEVLSRGDSERVKARRSSRGSAADSDRRRRRSSRAESIEEEQMTEKKTKSSHKKRDAAAAAIAGGVLTAAALKHHNSRDRNRKESLNDRLEEIERDDYSRSDDLTQSTERDYAKTHELGPRIPFTGAPTDSEMTRESILSASTERPLSSHAESRGASIQDVRRGTFQESRSRATSLDTRTPETARNVGERTSVRSLAETLEQQHRSGTSTPSKSRNPALLAAAAGLGGAAAGYTLGKGKSPYRGHHGDSRESASPVQSVSSYRDDLNDPLIPQALSPRSPLLQETYKSETSARPPLSSPALSTNKDHIYPLAPDADSFASRSKRTNFRPESDIYDEATPQGDDADQWLHEEHEKNNKLRDSATDGSYRDSYIESQRDSRYTADNDSIATGDYSMAEQKVRGVGANPRYVNLPLGLESNVASLIDPSTIDGYQSSGISMDRHVDTKSFDRQGDSFNSLQRHSPAQRNAQVAEEITEEGGTTQPLRSATPRSPPVDLERQRTVVQSPRQSEAESHRRSHSSKHSTPVQLGASGVPDLSDPLPEIGHGLDAVSEKDSRHSDASSPISAKEGREHVRPQLKDSQRDTRYFSFAQYDDESVSSHGARDAALAGGAVGAAGLAAGLAARKSKSPSVRSHEREVLIEDQSEDVELLEPHTHKDAPRPSVTPVNAPTQHDEGYVSGAYARSVDTPRAARPDTREYSEEDLAEYEAAMGQDDPFMNADNKRETFLSGKSDGLDSPMYDSSTGRGIDRIQSKDVVALMDHLTVRDAQRNARDTEILVTLVRSAAEMRQNFEGLKQFIREQDRMIMKNTDRDAEMTVQRVLGGPRPQPQSSPRPPRVSFDEESVSSAKRQNVFKRALKGLGGRNANDLARIEDMLNQLLDDVEYLKDVQSQGMPSQPISSAGDKQPSLDSRVDVNRQDGFSSYEALRANAGSGYEPEGLAGTGSTPNQSGNFQAPQLSPSAKHTYHSGYDGRRDSINRVSTVLEGDEEDDFDRSASLTPKPLAPGKYHSSPNQDTRRSGMVFGTPPQKFSSADNSLENTPERHRNRSSVPKVSRWSKTTASSIPEGYDSRRQSQEQRPLSDGSLGSQGVVTRDTQYYDYDDYESTPPASRRDARSIHSAQTDSTRSPSPLIPSEAGSASNQQRPYASHHRDSNDSSNRDSYHSSQRDSYESAQRRSYGSAPPGPLPSSASPASSRRLSGPSNPDNAELHLPLEGEDYDDPKYHAHRKSLLLHAPVAVPGKMKTHGSHLEREAIDYEDEGSQLGSVPGNTSNISGSDLSTRTVESEFDPNMWGSNPALSLARAQRLGNIGNSNPPALSARKAVPVRRTVDTSPTQSPVEALPSPRSGGGKEDTLPIQKPEEPKGKIAGGNARYGSHSGAGGYEEDEAERKYTRSNAPPRTFDRLYYSSPLGSGHLLEPIQEVRYSLETDRTPPLSREHTPEPSITPQPAVGSRLNPLKKITGPRPMSSKGSPLSEGSPGRNVLRRKVVGGGS
ncbi:hypothetical protein CAC42_1852 [Sphaceloma murrayae]|uniref:Uncharacterized protein n=1 Tax=Sphaceloma murrayae TaxID=2082308 RepID=A0A2K1QVN7_9PEZI|nr:hypothetical protein CAC42_1852 [Sphaceloma murrayae]